MGLFGGKDWNIVAILFERSDTYQVNGNRGKGGNATTIRDNVKNHPRTIYYAVFDQKGGFIEGGPGAGQTTVQTSTLTRLIREIPTNKTVRQVLAMLEKGATEKAAKALEWGGYPVKEEPPPA